jgi:hypothetical protein
VRIKRDGHIRLKRSNNNLHMLSIQLEMLIALPWMEWNVQGMTYLMTGVCQFDRIIWYTTVWERTAVCASLEDSTVQKRHVLSHRLHFAVWTLRTRLVYVLNFCRKVKHDHTGAIGSRCETVYAVQSWPGGYTVSSRIPVLQEIQRWTVEITFSSAVKSLNVMLTSFVLFR